MFSTYVNNTPFTSEAANDFFADKINGDPIGGDDSFMSSLRALIYDRLEDDEQLFVEYKTVKGKPSTGESGESRTARGLEPSQKNCFKVVMLNGLSAENSEWIDFMENRFAEVRPGWVELPRVRAFFKKAVDIVCFVNVENRESLVVLNSADRRRMHYIQCGIPVFFPWFFTKENPVKPDELELIKSLQQTTQTQYLAILREMAKKYNFESARIRRRLAGFETSFETERLDGYMEKNRSIMNSIDEKMREIDALLHQKAETETMILGIETKIASGDKSESEVMNYFLNSKVLHLDSVYGDRIKFSVKTYFNVWDEDMAETLINNKRSYAYPSYVENKDEMQKLYTAIFIDHKLRIKTCAAYQLSASGGVNALSNYVYDESVFYDCIPNTHIDRYACMGNYTRIVNDMVKKYDYIGAIEACICSAGSLNFGDSTVAKEFFKNIVNGHDNGVNNVCIELPDGKVVDYKGAIEWLKNEAKETASEEG